MNVRVIGGGAFIVTLNQKDIQQVRANSLTDLAHPHTPHYVVRKIMTIYWEETLRPWLLFDPHGV